MQYTETIEIKHDVVRAIFPKMPSAISRKPYLAQKQDFEDAKVERYLERTVTLTGGRRKVEFPVEMKLIIGFSPNFVPAQGKEVYKRRPIQRLRITFFKEHI